MCGGSNSRFDSRCLNETLIRWIVDYNFPGISAYPKIKTYAAAKPDLREQSEIDKTLVVDIGLPVSTAYFYETYGIPIPAKGEDLVRPRSPQASPVAQKEDQTGKFAEGMPDDKDAADVIADGTAALAMKVTDDIYMTPLKRLVEESTSLDDLRDRIYGLWGEMDPESLGIIMARGMMLADMAGRYEVFLETEGKKKT